MSAVITLDLVPAGELRLSPARLHGAACGLVEPLWEGEHDAQRKPRSRSAPWSMPWV
jgi:hypothetical protein